MSTGTAVAPTNTAVAKKPDAQTPARKFRNAATAIAKSMLNEWVGEDRANEATGRLSAAFAASAGSARDPSDFYACTVESIGTCIAIAALTGIMPGVGSTALAYVVPQRPRSDEPPQLQYSLSHRGLNVLARRSGQTMIAIPIGPKDVIQSSSDGDVEIVTRDIDNPPMTWDELRGVVVIVKEIKTGMVVHRGWMPKKLIEARRAMSRSFTGKYPQYSPWTKWPVEQAMKTAMHYCIGRGWCVIDDNTSARAMTADSEMDRIPEQPPVMVHAETVGQGRAALLTERMQAQRAPDVSQQPPPEPGPEPEVDVIDEEPHEPAPEPEVQQAPEVESQETPDRHQPAGTMIGDFHFGPNDTESTAYQKLNKGLVDAQSTDRVNEVMWVVQECLNRGIIQDPQFARLSESYSKRVGELAPKPKAAPKGKPQQQSLVK